MNSKARILLYADNLWYFGEGMLGPLFAVFSQRVGGDILDISIAWASYLIVAGVMIIIFGRISDRAISKEKLVIIGYSLNAALTFCYLLVASSMQLLIVQAGLGVAAALATPTWNALYTKYHDRKNSGYVWGLADGQAQIVTGLAIAVGGIIVSFFSFTLLFLVMGSVQVVAAIYLSRILKK
jgi:predicted MFS family arabinose efflux permease